MPRNSSGTESLPAGNPVVNGTTIDPTWANNTLNDIAAEITDSLSRSGKGGMTAPLRTGDGSVAAPAHSFTLETGTGVYRGGAGELDVAILGVKRMDVKAAGVTVADLLTVSGTGGVVASGGDVWLTKAAAQAVSKQNGPLSIGTLDANEVSIVRNGSVVLATTSTSLDAKSRPIINVTDPTNPQDVATKNYADGRSPRVFGILLCGAAGTVTFSNGTGARNIASASYSTNVIVVTFSVALGDQYYSLVSSASVGAAAPILTTSTTLSGSCGIVGWSPTTGAARNWASGDIVHFVIHKV